MKKILPVDKQMTTEDLKHALVSLLVGVLTMASLQLVNGVIHIFQTWLVAGSSGTVSAITYMASRKIF